MYIVQTCLYSFTSTFHFPSGPISLVTPASFNSAQEPLPYVCTSGRLAMYPQKSAIWPVCSFPETANKNQKGYYYYF